MFLTPENIRNAFIFLNRVDLKGNEAQAMTELQMNLHLLQQSMQGSPPEEPDPET
jgi:hypothetical protein